MKIALIGYGKMGKEIEKIAVSRGHEVTLIIDITNPDDLTAENLRKCDVAIEFTIPASAVKNYFTCFEAGIPVVSGTTGWLDKKAEVIKRCEETGGTFFYGSNFSVGVNLFFELNKKLAVLMAGYPEYNVEMTEVHHIHKLDAPSGTAIALANDIISVNPDYTRWESGFQHDQQALQVFSERTGEVIGTHKIEWNSEADSIEIKHTAHNRQGLAMGAILAAEWLQGRTGVYGMSDLLSSGK